jgi:hypothetical protein
MDMFFFANIAITALTIFVCIYSYSLQFFSETKKGREWRNRIQQDAYVGLAIIFLTMGSCFLWVIFFYFKIFYF